jgi:hypothetical protein
VACLSGRDITCTYVNGATMRDRASGHIFRMAANAYGARVRGARDRVNHTPAKRARKLTKKPLPFVTLLAAEPDFGGFLLGIMGGIRKPFILLGV